MDNLTNKRSSLSSRASKIPQKLVQSTLLFSVRTSVSNHEGITKKINNMVFGSPRGSSSLSCIQQPKSLEISSLERSKLAHRRTFDAACIEQNKKQTVRRSNEPTLDYTPPYSTPDGAKYTMHTLKEMIQQESKNLLDTPREITTLICYTNLLLEACELDRLDCSKDDPIESIVEKVQQACRSSLSPSLCISSETFEREIPKIYLTRPTQKEFENMTSDQLALEATWFRRYFVGNAYATFIGSLEKRSKKQSTAFGIISIVQETLQIDSQYRIIIRSNQLEQYRYVVSENEAKETQGRLEMKGESRAIDHSRRLLPSFKSNDGTKNTARLMRAAILSVCPELDLRSFKELSTESVISAGLEKDLMAYDELQIPKHYKFGLLTINNGQITEESWFSNTGLSTDLQEFLNIMGDKINLKGYKGYAAGLDTKTGESGEFSYASKWKDYDIIFHVSALMPLKTNDQQQVFRKSHIGNDIVCIIFIEGNQLFDPNAIQSQFLHVYIIVRPEYKDNKRQWRIEVVRHKSVSEFGPFIPSPPVFNDQDLKSFLTLKLVSAENAALKADKFFIPNDKARLSLLSNHIKTGLSFRSTESPNSPEPKTSLSKSKLLHKANILEERRKDLMTVSSVDIAPLMVSPSRSTLLQGFKKGFSRKKSEKPWHEKTASQPKEGDLLIGQDIHVSTESFISEEQLFASSIYEQVI